MSSQEKVQESSILQEAVQYSYYTKWLTEDLFNMVIKRYDPTPDQYFGRWLIETFIRTIVKPMIADAKRKNSTVDDETIMDTINRILFHNGIAKTIHSYSLERNDIFGKTHSGIFYDNGQYALKDNLRTFYYVRNQLPADKKDIMSYKEFGDLVNYMLSPEIKELVQKIEFSKVTPDEYNVIYKDDSWFIVQPLTEKASCKYGNGSKWCTAARDINMFDDYNDSGKVITFIKKNTDGKITKWQIFLSDDEPSANEWKDERNESIEQDTLVSQLPNEAITKLFDLTKDFAFLTKEKKNELAEVYLKSIDTPFGHLTSLVREHRNQYKVRTFWENSPRHTYFSSLFGKTISEWAYSDIYYKESYDDNGYSYQEGYDKPWEHLTEDPEYATDIAECPVCKGNKYGIYVWNNELHDYDTSMTPQEFETLKRRLAYSPSQFSVDEIYKEFGGRYHVVDKEEWKKFVDTIQYKCVKCMGSGKEAGPSWNRDEELWSESQREEAGNIAEQESQSYAQEESFREFDRYDWEDSQYSEKVMDKALELLIEEGTSIPKEEKLLCIKTLINYAPHFSIEITIPEGFGVN